MNNKMEKKYTQFVDVEIYLEDKIEEKYQRDAREYAQSYFEENKSKLLVHYQEKLNAFVTRIIKDIPTCIIEITPEFNERLNRLDHGGKEREKINQRLHAAVVKSYQGYIDYSFSAKLEMEIDTFLYDLYLNRLTSSCTLHLKDRLDLIHASMRDEDYRFRNSFEITEQELSNIVDNLELGFTLELDENIRRDILNNLYEEVADLLLNNMHDLIRLIANQKK